MTTTATQFLAAPSRRLALGLAASALILTGILAAMVIDRVQVLRTGREVVLPIRPVDPRDLFKGDYARLGYDISRIDGALLAAGADVPRRGRVYVTLEQDAAGAWKPVAVTAERPSGLATNRVAIAGRLERDFVAPRAAGVTAPPRTLAVTYGLERYFVPEGTGTRIEDLARNATLSAIVAVGADGRSAIKGLVVDGKKVYEEPLL